LTLPLAANPPAFPPSPIVSNLGSMTHLVTFKSPQEEEEEKSRRDRLAERMASVIHLIVRKVVERHVERGNLEESASTELPSLPIPNSRKSHKIKDG
jgi:hypothetical protein